ncbi:PepSY-like domain-containing protein [Limnoglobus roseus]|uniref:Putative beta-lactamase-inhibitor-like PepSY-like domain-containing protein n=1 Tax=Limnoglobus roseus TaxID=2598579 RepID=A0A5C1AKN3_9BACT|nr:PepSY-like domain-containing protein [Limnoglobus roseus]QEL19470.1 hypothetical protein PX52LOC_06543 [Limnoglobus roseus]
MRALIGCVATVVLAVGVSRAGEEKIALDKLPKAVTAAVKKRFPKAEMVEAAKETEGDKTEYEVSLKDGTTKMDVMLSPDGKITLIEKVIDDKNLPKAVTAALAAKYPKATTKLAEEVVKVVDGKETLDFYEVILVAADKKTYEVQITADGTIKQTEEKKDEEKK